MLKHQRLLVVSLLFFVLLCVAHQGYGHGNHCHVSSKSGLIHIDVGETAEIPGKCLKATCEKNLTVAEIKCADYEVTSGCTRTNIDYEKPFPDCCPYDLCAVEDLKE